MIVDVFLTALVPGIRQESQFSFTEERGIKGKFFTLPVVGKVLKYKP